MKLLKAIFMKYYLSFFMHYEYHYSYNSHKRFIDNVGGAYHNINYIIESTDVILVYLTSWKRLMGGYITKLSVTFDAFRY